MFFVFLNETSVPLSGVMVHPLGDYACQPRDSSIVAHALTACYYINGASYTNGPTQTIAHSVAKVRISLLRFFFMFFTPNSKKKQNILFPEVQT